MTITIMRMETLEKDYELIRTEYYREKASRKCYNVTFDNGLAYAERILDIDNIIW